MKKICTLFLMIIISALSSILFAQEDYFPLTQGSYWIYLDNGSYSSRTDTMYVEITGTTTFKNYEYYVFRITCTHLGPDPYSIYYEYYRKDKDNNIYAYENQTDQLKYKFTADSGSSWVYFPKYIDPDTLDFIIDKKNFPTKIYNVDYNNCISIFSRYKYALDSDLKEYFSPGIGLIRRADNFGGWDLYKYKIFSDILELDKQSINSIFPNPVNNYLQINSKNEINRIDVYNSLGLNILNIETGLECTTKNIDVSSLSEGVYFIVIKSAKSTETNKFVIKR